VEAEMRILVAVTVVTVMVLVVEALQIIIIALLHMLGLQEALELFMLLEVHNIIKLAL
jgi:hypothetical protein